MEIIFVERKGRTGIGYADQTNRLTFLYLNLIILPYF